MDKIWIIEKKTKDVTIYSYIHNSDIKKIKKSDGTTKYKYF